MIEDKQCKNIIDLLNYDFDGIYYEIIEDAKLQMEYSEFIQIKNLLLEDYPLYKKIESTDQPFEIKIEDIPIYKEYQVINNKIEKALVKEAYYRGIKDAILLLTRANLFKENI